MTMKSRTGISEVPWSNLTRDQQDVRRKCLWVLYQAYLTLTPIYEIYIPRGLWVGAIVENLGRCVKCEWSEWGVDLSEKLSLGFDIIEDGVIKPILVDTPADAAPVIEYFHGVYDLLEYNSTYRIDRSKNGIIRDSSSVLHRFDTDVERLRRMKAKIRRSFNPDLWPTPENRDADGFCPFYLVEPLGPRWCNPDYELMVISQFTLDRWLRRHRQVGRL